MKAPFVRSPYNYDMEKVSSETGLLCLDASKTVQDQRDEVDINTIVRRFGLTGKLPDDVRTPQYGDFTNIGTFHEACNVVAEANEMFEELPAELRARFDNDPEKYVEFCIDERNLPEMVKLGLAKEVKSGEVAKVDQVVGSPGSGSPAAASSEVK